MARFENGWIKLSRTVITEDIGDNVYVLSLWVMFLAMANWKESKIIWRGKQRILPPGSVVFGYRELAERWECSNNTVKKWAKYLEETNRISLEVCTRGCLATIRNWEKYQVFGESDAQTSAQAMHTDCTASAHGVHLIEEGKKEEQIHVAEGELIFQIWNQNRGSLPLAKGLTSKRRIKANARWKEKPDPAYWAATVLKMSRSPFCLGEKSRGDWRADFDFLLKPDTHIRVQEGQLGCDDPDPQSNKIITLDEIRAGAL